MIISNYIRTAAAIIFLGIGLCQSQTVFLKLDNGNTLTGEITKLSENSLTLRSPLSETPLDVVKDSIEKIDYEKKTQPSKLEYNERIKLTNGDILLGKIETLNDKELILASSTVGPQKIPAKFINQIEFGVRENSLIFNGSDKLEQWKHRRGNWNVESNGSFTSKGAGSIATELPDTDNIHIGFTLKWTAIPNFNFRFCSESERGTLNENSYEFTFTSAGMQIRRRTKSSTVTDPIAIIPIEPIDFDHKKLELDFYINRKNREITLFVDKNKINTWNDASEAPAGNYIIFSDNNSNSEINLSNIVVFNTHAESFPRQKLSNIANSKKNMIAMSNGDIYQFNSISIKSNTDENSAKSRIVEAGINLSKEPLIATEKEISSIYFYKDQGADDNDANKRIIISIENLGRISISEPKFSANEIQGKHLILGDISLPTKIVTSLSLSK